MREHHSIVGWLGIRGVVCSDFCKWVTSQPDQRPGYLVAVCKRADWLIWLAAELGYTNETLVRAVRASWLRSLHEYLPVELEDGGLGEHAKQLRALPNDVMASVALETTEGWLHIPALGHITRRAKEAARIARIISWSMWKIETAKVMTESGGWASALVLWAVQAWILALEGKLVVATQKPNVDRATEHCLIVSEIRTTLPDLAKRWEKELANWHK